MYIYSRAQIPPTCVGSGHETNVCLTLLLHACIHTCSCVASNEDHPNADGDLPFSHQLSWKFTSGTNNVTFMLVIKRLWVFEDHCINVVHGTVKPQPVYESHEGKSNHHYYFKESNKFVLCDGGKWMALLSSVTVNKAAGQEQLQGYFQLVALQQL